MIIPTRLVSLTTLALAVFSAGPTLASPTPQHEASALHSRAMEATYLKENMATSSQSRPTGAFGTTYKLSGGNLFAWQSKSPHNEADTEAVYIITHGVDRNANNYFTYLNNAYKQANSAGLANAPTNTLRVAPAFYDESADGRSLQDSTLAWGAGNRWCIGEGSTHPRGSNMSPFTVYDELIEKFSDRSAFPNVKTITFIGHGCGAITTQRFAALRTADDGGVKIRYLVGNPSTMLYFSEDRPSKVNRKSCSNYNDFFFGLNDVYIPYGYSGSPTGTFSNYARRDVRYLIGLNDNGAGGDQSCAAKAMGGVNRKDRSLAYWKYINLLAGKSPSSVSQFPGNFDQLDTSSFAGATLNHKLVQIAGVAHSAPATLGSQKGQQAVFGQ